MRKKDDWKSKCPHCGNGPVHTIDSRHDTTYRTRRKLCASCHERWNTVEVPEELISSIIKHRVLLDNMKFTIEQILGTNPLLKAHNDEQ